MSDLGRVGDPSQRGVVDVRWAVTARAGRIVETEVAGRKRDETLRRD
jgi:hypothetical protein